MPLGFRVERHGSRNELFLVRFVENADCRPERSPCGLRLLVIR